MTPDQKLAMEVAAMDVALGALDREARRAAEARMRSDPAFLAEVERWQALLAPLVDELDPVLPPASVWAGIAAETAPHATPTPAPALRKGLWHSLPLWRTLGLAGPALAALALVIATPSQPPVAPGAPPPALLSASLKAADGTPLLAATFDPLRGTVVLTPANGPDMQGRVPELWVIEGETPPRSLGVIALAAPNAHTVPSSRLSGLQPGVTLAISMEPIGGSPTGLPTGPVIATGTLGPV
jgi:anti-sigma-K factor RskA